VGAFSLVLGEKLAPCAPSGYEHDERGSLG